MRAVFHSPKVQKIYISWVPDSYNLTKAWVTLLKEILDPIESEGKDEAKREIKKFFAIIDENAGDTIVDVEKRNRSDVTDLLVVGTSKYISTQQQKVKSGESLDLIWFLEKRDSCENAELTLWMAPLESLKLERYSLLANIKGWHWLRETRFPQPESENNHEQRAKVLEAIEEAIDKILGHVSTVSCPDCSYE